MIARSFATAHDTSALSQQAPGPLPPPTKIAGAGCARWMAVADVEAADVEVADVEVADVGDADVEVDGGGAGSGGGGGAGGGALCFSQWTQVQSPVTGSKARRYHASAASKQQRDRSVAAAASAGPNGDKGNRWVPGAW